MIARSQLLERKEDLYEAIRALDRDREDGTIDPESYRATRSRYELEAAEVLEQLDGLAAPDAKADERKLPASRPLLVGSLGVALGALAIFLAAALHDRTGSAGGPTPAPTATLPPAVARAEAEVVRHPRSVPALLGLGTVLMNAGDNADADSVFRHAMTLAPARPEPPTMHAMVLSSTGKVIQARSVLHSVERSHPAYARAWLLDGILSARNAATRPHAIVAWKRFLKLQPTGNVARTVRGLLAQEESRA